MDISMFYLSFYEFVYYNIHFQDVSEEARRISDFVQILLLYNFSLLFSCPVVVLYACDCS